MFQSDDWPEPTYRDKTLVGREFEVFPVDRTVTATVVKYFPREQDSYGEYTMGEEEISLVFKVGDSYFRKYGVMSSYGDISWNGKVVSVTPTVKTIEVFE